MNYDHIKLENQLCFPLYAASRLVTQSYQPELEKLDLTYPQYLVLMILWETDGLSINNIAKKLILNTNTITPLLKRMEKKNLIIKKKSIEDERKTLINLSKKGKNLKEKASKVPFKLIEKIGNKKLIDDLNLEDLKQKLNQLICILQDSNK